MGTPTPTSWRLLVNGGEGPESMATHLEHFPAGPLTSQLGGPLYVVLNGGFYLTFQFLAFYSYVHRFTVPLGQFRNPQLPALQ